MSESLRRGGYAGAPRTADTSGRSLTTLRPSQWVALATSVVFVVVGIAGFIATGFDDFAAHDTG